MIEIEILKGILNSNLDFYQKKRDTCFRDNGVSDADARLELNRLGTKIDTYKECLSYIDYLLQNNEVKEVESL